ncbi:energy transducer TonB [Pontibacter beigongshangensis]|uniref:energy transducer TonB n=1 Tax=Pontibacter beigongshangensis TaxID=2574733 RepID=UPI0016507669|nr:energy transducer TonB [Pontibacter beigongshangensis]
MEVSKLAKASLDDIVFAGRNRAYGAYLLRRLYNKHITQAAIISILLFAAFISIPLVKEAIKGEAPPAPVIERVVTEVELAQPPPVENTPPPPPPPPPPPDAPPPPPPQQATVKYTPPVVKRNEEVRDDEEDLAEAKELVEISAGIKTQEGVKNMPAAPIGDINGTGAVAEVVEEKPYTFAEQMPSFPGGEAAMFGYISKAIKYPQQAIRAGVEGTVYVSFVVSKTGEISDIQVLRGLGAGCDEEAIRVIKSMPNWTPGKQNGRAVPVRYNIPIKYTLK